MDGKGLILDAAHDLATATRMVLLSIRSPRAEMGGALSHAPDSFCCDASKRALPMESVALDSRLEAKAPATGRSQAFWVPVAAPVGVSEEPELAFQSLIASALSGQGSVEQVGGIKARVIEEVPAAEARKAEGASMVTLLMPNPPRLMGRDAWIQFCSDRWILQMDSSSDRRIQSKESRAGDLKLGAVLRICITLGMASAFWMRQSASCACKSFRRLPRVSSCSILNSQTT